MENIIQAAFRYTVNVAPWQALGADVAIERALAGKVSAVFDADPAIVQPVEAVVNVRAAAVAVQPAAE